MRTQEKERSRLRLRLVGNTLFLKYIYMLFHGQEVRIKKNFAAEVLNVRPEPLRRGPCIQDRGQSFLDTDRPRPGNNIFIFWPSFRKEYESDCLIMP